MCTYTLYTVIYAECEKFPKYTEERTYWDPWDSIPATYIHCPDSTLDSTRLVGSSRVTGECPCCAAGQEEEEDDEVMQEGGEGETIAEEEEEGDAEDQEAAK
jgi:hypothetical protein